MGYLEYGTGKKWLKKSKLGRLLGTSMSQQEPELRITLNRGQRGGYGWEIQYSCIDKKELLGTIGEADRKLREKYLSEGLCPPK